jgi:hypothetical protein
MILLSKHCLLAIETKLLKVTEVYMRTKATIYNISKLSRKDIVRFALFCAKQANSKAPEAIACINVVERWLDNKATSDECRAAANATFAADAADAAYAAADAADATAYATAYAAASCAADAAADAAYAAANAAARAAARTAQEQYLYELLHIDDIIEQTLLKHKA